MDSHVLTRMKKLISLLLICSLLFNLIIWFSAFSVGGGLLDWWVVTPVGDTGSLFADWLDEFDLILAEICIGTFLLQ